MTLVQLKYFVTVVEKKSFSIAAKELHVTHQNISKSIKQLEDELNIPLLKRSKKGVFLSSIGQPVYEYAKQILTCITHIEEYSANSLFNQIKDKSIYGTFIIHSTHAFSFLIINIIQKMNLHYPNISIIYKTFEPAFINHTLRTDTAADIVCTCDSIGSALIETLSNKGKIIKIAQEPLKVLVKKESPLASYKSLSKKILNESPLVFYREDSNITPLYYDLMKQHGIKGKTTYFSSSYEIIQEYLYRNMLSVSTSLTVKRSANMSRNQCVLVPLTVKELIDEFIFIPTTSNAAKIPIIEIFLKYLNESI